MSKTYEIICHKCKVYLWIGQGNEGKEYIYGTEEALNNQKSFFFAHYRHPLEFMESQEVSALIDDYFDFEEVPNSDKHSESDFK